MTFISVYVGNTHSPLSKIFSISFSLRISFSNGWAVEHYQCFAAVVEVLYEKELSLFLMYLNFCAGI